MQFSKHAIENNHLTAVKDDFTKLEGGYRNNTHKRKIAEALMIKVMRHKRKISGIETFKWNLNSAHNCLFIY